MITALHSNLYLLIVLILNVLFSYQFSFRKFASIGIATISFTSINPSNSIEYNPKSISALENIERVKYSLKYIQEDINKGSEPKDIVKEINSLIKNYKLRENVISSLNLLQGSKYNEAEKFGKEAFEDLAQVSEYFPDVYDDVSGSKVIPREVLEFALDATNAASSKLSKMIELFPTEVLTKVAEDLNNEFSSN